MDNALWSLMGKTVFHGFCTSTSLAEYSEDVRPRLFFSWLISQDCVCSEYLWAAGYVPLQDKGRACLLLPVTKVDPEAQRSWIWPKYTASKTPIGAPPCQLVELGEKSHWHSCADTPGVSCALSNTTCVSEPEVSCLLSAFMRQKQAHWLADKEGKSRSQTLHRSWRSWWCRVWLIFVKVFCQGYTSRVLCSLWAPGIFINQQRELTLIN